MTDEDGEVYDVAVVGLGPTGATLANLLGICGLSVLVLDREAAIYHLPRAVHFDDEIMRIFQNIGVAETLAKIVRINPGMRFVDTRGKLLLDWPRPGEVGPHGWHASYRFHQPDLERILRGALQRFSTVKVRTQAEVLSVEDRGNFVELRYEERKTGKRRAVFAGYVVGCDGARSLVRRTMNTEMEDLGFHERWLVVDVLLNGPKPELGDHTIQYCNPERPATYCRSPGMRRRWEIAVLDGEESDEIATTDSVWRLLKDWLAPGEAEIERKAVYTFHSAIARRWRIGRLLLAGDAAHLTPPFMGQGMCAGIRDAANLAWKLALCAKGLADETLLDSYQAERMPHAREYIETAIRLGGLINTAGTRQALEAAFRQDDGTARMESISPRLGPGLAAGSDEHAGRLFPQPQLANGEMMDDVCGYAPVLLAESALVDKGGDLPFPVLTTEREPAVAACLKAMDTRAALIRPDRYVLGTATTREMLLTMLRNTFASPLQQGASV
ncbi:bifunctional 3-(3-hydroxy-phenyl)propionate/3-hydroxycinnamic acid hydroxylase [Hoeflea sp. TYP-13]|uniref:bifunctional 3-(3-hydroxy-phenyl)propionate/3-hydroxycinnamic acid hydroxylase n=1 Tax=Hoeflea sp. TYP-13 TaxID=3230023 RepID=UPI0034C5F792